MKAKIKAPFQVVHEGKRYTDGDVVDAPEPTVRSWITAGYAEETSSGKKSSGEKPVEPPEQTRDSAADVDPSEVDVSQYHTGGGWYEIEGERYRGEDAARAALTK